MAVPVPRRRILALLVLALCCAASVSAVDDITPKMSDERVVFSLEVGDIEFGFYPDVAPVTSQHIFTLARMGAYTSNHFFRIDKGFVAQTADVMGGRTIRMPAEMEEEAHKNVPLEVKEGVKHHEGIVSMARGGSKDSAMSSFFIMLGSAPHLDMEYGVFGYGVLSMGRYDDPNSGTSSFSILLGDAAHLDMTYTIFAKVTRGMEVLHKLEELPTKREGIFVMPLERISILSTYWYRVNHPAPMLSLPECGKCEDDLAELQRRFASQADDLQRTRKKCLPA